MQKKNILFLTVIFITLVTVSLASCADESIRASDIGVNIVFDYESYDSLPRQRLSAYVKVDSDVKRIKTITVSNSTYPLEWKVNSPRLVSNNPKAIGTEPRSKNDAKYYAGYSNFTVEKGMSFPTGSYKFTCTDYDDKTFDFNFYVSYPSYLSNARASEYPSVFTSGYSVFYAIYADGILVYYGEKNPDWDNPAKLKDYYENATSYRVCYKLNGNVVCMMPEEILAE